MILSERTVSLRELASQNHYAARVIQALARGHLCRKELWSPQGILTVAMALRIQRVWRGFLGRRRAAHRYLDFVRQKREIIRGLCRCWKARRTLRIKRAEFLNRTATTLQCAYRSRASRKYFMELKRKALERMATRLQKAIRGFVCRRWVFRLRSLADVTLTDMKRIIHEDIVVANTITHRMTLQCFTLSDLQQMRANLRRSSVTFLSRPVSNNTSPDTSRPASPTIQSSRGTALGALPMQFSPLPPPWGPNTEQWRTLHISLAQLIGTNRPEFAIDLLSIILHQNPTFLPAAFTLLCSYLYSWCSGGTTGARLIREDHLEEGLGMMMRLQEAQKRMRIRTKNIASLQCSCSSLLNSELIAFVGEETHESDLLLLLEKTYFWNGFRAAGCNARTMSLMASFVLASQFSEFGGGSAGNFMIGHGSGVGRARRLMNRVRDCSAYREAESVSLRLQILEHIFESPHESVLKHRVGMRDLKQEAGEQQEGLATVTSVDLECFRAGEMLLVTAKIATPRLAAAAPTTPALTTASSSSSLSLSSGQRKMELVRESDKAKWSASVLGKGNERVLMVRPLILLPLEVEHLYSAAVKYFAQSTGKPEQEILMKPKWRTLSEFVSQGVRLVSCGRGRFVDEDLQQEGKRETGAGFIVPLISGVRLVLPSIEYRRQERNSLRVESHCAKLIQRAFRGFQGRSLWRRLHLRILEEKRQRAELAMALQRSSKLRAARYFQLSLIQSRVKGWIHRRRLNVMRLAALRIQCLARCRQARLRVRHERMRKSLGPEVIEMLRRVVSVSGHTLTAVVYRCGGSYKIVGFEGEQSRPCQYVGYVYEPQVASLLAEHNQQFQGDSKAIQLSRVMPWQHSRVIEVLLDAMSLTTPITSLTRELGGSKTKKELVFVAKKGLTGGGVDSTPSRRVLVDQAMIVKKYDELMSLKEEREQKERRKKNRLKYLV